MHVFDVLATLLNSHIYARVTLQSSHDIGPRMDKIPQIFFRQICFAVNLPDFPTAKISLHTVTSEIIFV